MSKRSTSFSRSVRERYFWVFFLSWWRFHFSTDLRSLSITFLLIEPVGLVMTSKGVSVRSCYSSYSSSLEVSSRAFCSASFFSRCLLTKYCSKFVSYFCLWGEMILGRFCFGFLVGEAWPSYPGIEGPVFFLPEEPSWHKDSLII